MGDRAMFSTEQIAKVCHEVNRAYCQSLGDYSQEEWERSPGEIKKSAILGVDLHLNNPDAGPWESHENWMKEKIKDGWMYGPVKNSETKEHPCLVPFEGLPKAQQAKDFIFRAVVLALKDLR